MSNGPATPVLAKALDADYEVPTGATLIGQNARLMQMYMAEYGLEIDVFNNFSLNAHHNCRYNPNALFKDKEVTAQMVQNSRVVEPPLRLYDASPVCDGAAAVVLAPRDEARAYTDQPVHILASSVATDWMRLAERQNPLSLSAAQLSARKAFRRANINLADVDFFEVHDAFSIMSCLLLEAVGFAKPGQGWRLAVDEEIGQQGKIPITTMGGLKARGHPIGATALYQTCEIVLQLTGRAGEAQLTNANVALLQSVGGAAATVITHVFAT